MPHGVLPLPERRLPAAAGRRHRQDDQRRAGGPLPHLRPHPGRGVHLRELVPRPARRRDVPQRRPDAAVHRRRAAPGRDAAAARPSGGTVEVEATARSIFPIHTLEIVQQGRVVRRDREAEARAPRASPARRSEWTATPGWPRAARPAPTGRAASPRRLAARGIVAHTSPVYVALRRATTSSSTRRPRSTC